MSSEGNGKDRTEVGEYRKVRKNGDVDVYERVTKQDPETGRTVEVSRRLKGRIKAGTTEIVPPRPRRGRAEPPEVAAVRWRTDAEGIVRWVGDSSGIDRDLAGAFGEDRAAEILPIVRYLVGCGDPTLPPAKEWRKTPGLPAGLGRNKCERILRELGADREGVRSYFRLRAAALKPEAAVAYDASVLSCVPGIHWERLQDKGRRDLSSTLKVLTLCSAGTLEPVAFAALPADRPDDHPDVEGIEEGLRQMEWLGVGRPLVVTDAGVYRRENVIELTRRDMQFLTLLENEDRWVQNLVDDERDLVTQTASICPFDTDVHGAAAATNLRRLGVDRYAAADDPAFSRKLFAYVFLSRKDMGTDVDFFDEWLTSLKLRLERGEIVFDPILRYRMQQYFVVGRKGRDGRVQVSIKEEAVDRTRRYYGYYSLLGSRRMDPFEVLENHRMRSQVEGMFIDAVTERPLDGEGTGVWDQETLQGRLFVQFAALGYLSHLQRRLKEVRDSLGGQAPGKDGLQLGRERMLVNWLNSHSPSQVLDWFECVDPGKHRTVAEAERWSEDSVACDRMLMEKLGILK